MDTPNLVSCTNFHWMKLNHFKKGIKPVISRLKKKVIAIENDIHNEGQVEFTGKIEDLNYEIRFLQGVLNIE